MRNKIEEIQELIRDLRDSKTHVCLADERDENGEVIDDSRYCSCGEYDTVINKLDSLKPEL